MREGDQRMTGGNGWEKREENGERSEAGGIGNWRGKKVEEGWEKGRIKKREQADWKC
jgi:hypothetical protein